MVFFSKFFDKNFVLILVNFVLILYGADNQYPFLGFLVEKMLFFGGERLSPRVRCC